MRDKVPVGFKSPSSVCFHRTQVKIGSDLASLAKCGLKSRRVKIWVKNLGEDKSPSPIEVLEG